MSVLPLRSESPAGLIIVYDGDCPLCKRYVRMIRLKQTLGDVVLENARERGSGADIVKAHGLELDDGMAVVYRGKIYYGYDAVNFIALVSSPVGTVNKLNALIFRCPIIARLLYPVMKMGRRILLKVLNIPRLKL